MLVVKHPRKLLGSMALALMAHLERSFYERPGMCWADMRLWHTERKVVVAEIKTLADLAEQLNCQLQNPAAQQPEQGRLAHQAPLTRLLILGDCDLVVQVPLVRVGPGHVCVLVKAALQVLH